MSDPKENEPEFDAEKFKKWAESDEGKEALRRASKRAAERSGSRHKKTYKGRCRCCRCRSMERY